MNRTNNIYGSVTQLARGLVSRAVVKRQPERRYVQVRILPLPQLYSNNRSSTMSIDNNDQGQNVPKIIRTPEDVEVLITSLGYKTVAFLESCGVKYATFQCWKKLGRIPNDSALILFNYVKLFPSAMDHLRAIRVVANVLGDTNV